MSSNPCSNPLKWRCQCCGKGGRPDEFGRKNCKMILIRCRDGISGPLAHEHALKAGGQTFVETLLDTGSVEAALAAGAASGLHAGSMALVKQRLNKSQLRQLERAGYVLDHM